MKNDSAEHWPYELNSTSKLKPDTLPPLLVATYETGNFECVYNQRRLPLTRTCRTPDYTAEFLVQSLAVLFPGRDFIFRPVHRYSALNASDLDSAIGLVSNTREAITETNLILTFARSRVPNLTFSGTIMHRRFWLLYRKNILDRGHKSLFRQAIPSAILTLLIATNSIKYIVMFLQSFCETERRNGSSAFLLFALLSIISRNTYRSHLARVFNIRPIRHMAINGLDDLVRLTEKRLIRMIVHSDTYNHLVLHPVEIANQSEIARHLVEAYERNPSTIVRRREVDDLLQDQSNAYVYLSTRSEISPQLTSRCNMDLVPLSELPAILTGFYANYPHDEMPQITDNKASLLRSISKRVIEKFRARSNCFGPSDSEKQPTDLIQIQFMFFALLGSQVAAGFINLAEIVFYGLFFKRWRSETLQNWTLA